MRFAGFCALGLLVVATPSLAADFPVLRGTTGPFLSAPTYFPWSGFYVGGQGTLTSATTQFTGGTGDLIAYILRNTVIESEAQVSQWTTLSDSSTSGAGWGGFVGYNAQWDDAIVGIEFNYTRTDLYMETSDSLGRSYTTSTEYWYNVFVDAEASVRVTDLGSLRLRGGWGAYSFMPYAFVGVAAARADVRRTATVEIDAIDISGAGRPPLGGVDTRSDNRDRVFAYGFSAGGGFDWALMPNLFLRAEYEYMRFSDLNGMVLEFSMGRAGLGFKF